MITFEYLNDFGLKRTVNIETEPLEVKPPKEGENYHQWAIQTKNAIWRPIGDVLSPLNLDLRTHFILQNIFFEIKFLGINLQDWYVENTAKRMDFWFLSPITTEPLMPRIKYKFKLNEQGIRLYKLIDSLYVLTDYNSEIIKETFKKAYDETVKYFK